MTVLDHAAGDPAWSFKEVGQHGLAFPLLYWWEQRGGHTSCVAMRWKDDTRRGRAPTQGAASARPVRSSSVRAQLVPHTPDRDQAVAEGTKLLAQVANMGVDYSVDAAVLEAPDALQ
jgi:hypothetical protein